MKRISLPGFTIIELLIFITILLLIGVVATTSIRNVRAENRDQTRKADLNTLDYQLESFYEENGYYPAVLNSETLPGVDSEALLDNKNNAVGTPGSTYTYTVRGCGENKCKGFELKVDLEKEAPFIKTSLNQ